MGNCPLVSVMCMVHDTHAVSDRNGEKTMDLMNYLMIGHHTLVAHVSRKVGDLDTHEVGIFSVSGFENQPPQTVLEAFDETHVRTVYDGDSYGDALRAFIDTAQTEIQHEIDANPAGW